MRETFKCLDLIDFLPELVRVCVFSEEEGSFTAEEGLRRSIEMMSSFPFRSMTFCGVW